jgi:hypothetical protein
MHAYVLCKFWVKACAYNVPLPHSHDIIHLVALLLRGLPN